MPEQMAETDVDGSSRRSHLFSMRLWLEDLGEGRTEWRGQVRHVLSGETRYLRGWSGLEQLLKAMMRSTATNEENRSDRDIIDGSR